jgi:hypothetical protein
MKPTSRGDSHQPPERAASALSRSGDLRELIRDLARASALRIHDTSTAPQVD